MNSKTLPFGIIFPKITSETKTASTVMPTAKAAKKTVVAIPRSAAIKTARRSISFGWIVPLTSLASVAIIIGLLGFHLYIVNAYSSKGYELKRHQAAITELTDKQNQLLVQQAEMASINKVNDAANHLGLVPITHEEYITTNQLSQK